MGLLSAALAGSALAVALGHKRARDKSKALGGITKRADGTDTTALAPGPSATSGAPPPPVLNPGADHAQAALAGQRQRKRAAQGSLMSRPLLKSTTPPASFKPKALIGY